MRGRGPELSAPSLGPEDWAAVRRICCETGNAGAAIERERWDFFAEHWVGPYQKLRPDWTYVVREPRGGVAGYLTGCPDTRAYERERALFHRLPLFLKILARRYPKNADTRRFVRRFMGLEKGPELKFSAELRKRLATDYHAHLHMNLEASLRGKGAGGALIRLYSVDLKRAGGNGIHLFCGEGPLAFYKKNGFEILERIEVGAAVPVYAMGLKL